jgi:hypothetical protein
LILKTVRRVQRFERSEAIERLERVKLFYLTIPHHCRRVRNRLDDFRVAGAAAEVA